MKAAIIFFMLSLPLIAQKASTPEPAKITPADCTVIDRSPACQSFNELVVAHDKDLIGMLQGDYITYVCFEKDEDVFMLFSISPATPSLYQKQKSSAMETQRSTAFYQKFKNGVGQDFQFLAGTWKRIMDSEYFSTDPGDEGISFNQTELIYTDTYENLRKTKTQYSISIRRSTLRFAANYAFPSEDNKATTSLDDTGHCLFFDVRSTSSSLQR
jgi:hypothetical protein